MRWQGGRRSGNVEDRRGMSPRGMAVGGGVGTLLIILVAMLFGADPLALLSQMQGNQQVQVPEGSGSVDPAHDELGEFVSVVLADTEDVWSALFEQQGAQYVKPRLVLFSDQVESACGTAGTAVGPFYCPADQRVYIDLTFYEMLRSRFRAPGDFAQAYVIAHEIGHHVQNLMGITDQVHGMRERLTETEYNALSVRLELQADFFAGVWAHHAQRSRQILEEGDIEEALNAASAIGDDRVQKQTQGYVVPDAFTHGTSAQRVRWFRRGFETGDLSQGDTFNADVL
jgi:predicted metalloprotease